MVKLAGKGTAAMATRTIKEGEILVEQMGGTLITIIRT